MSTFLKFAGVFVVGAIAIVVGLVVLPIVAGILKLLFGIAVIAAIGFVVIKGLSLLGGAAPRPEKAAELPDAKTESSATSITPETKQGMSEAEAARLFEQAKRKNTNGGAS